MSQIDYFFTLQSPWSYLAAERLFNLAEEHGAKIRFVPISTPTLFSQTGGVPVNKRHPSRLALRMQELIRWKKHLNVKLTLVPAFFPADDSYANKIVLASLELSLDPRPLILAFHKMVWVEDMNVADVGLVNAKVRELCLEDAEDLISTATSESMSQKLASNTSEAFDRGVFGVPTFIIDKEVLWGQDRLGFVEELIS